MSQSPPPIPQLVYGKYHWFTSFVGDMLLDTPWANLNRAQIVVLGGIKAGEVRSSRLASLIGVSRQAISKTVRELENQGLLRQERDKEQANSMVLKLTYDGQSCIDTVEQKVQLLDTRLRTTFGDSAVEDTIKVLSADWESLMKEESFD